MEYVHWVQLVRDSLRSVELPADPKSLEKSEHTLESYRSTLANICSTWITDADLSPSPPTRPSLGGRLGRLTFIARWLVEPESLSLALIVGMLGFGLVGSAVSTFVQERRQQRADSPSHKIDKQRPLVSDLPSVVIRGVSAAVVVFLAVEGGLAIFGASTTEPNPYVLLLTCLIAPVFSGSVWGWAGGWFRGRLDGDPLVAHQDSKEVPSSGERAKGSEGTPSPESSDPSKP